jgi:hypothetical protein
MARETLVTPRPDGIRCGNCKQTHPTVADVRACYALPREPAASEGARNFCQSLLRERVLHPDFADVTEETINTFSKSRASKFIDVHKQQPMRPKEKDKLAKFLETFDDVEEAYYALRDHDNPEIVHFYKLVDGRHERMLFQVYGSPGALRQNRVRRYELADRVMQEIAADPKAAMLLFGEKLEICGACGSPLTDPESRARRIGPVCARKRGW